MLRTKADSSIQLSSVSGNRRTNRYDHLEVHYSPTPQIPGKQLTLFSPTSSRRSLQATNSSSPSQAHLLRSAYRPWWIRKSTFNRHHHPASTTRTPFEVSSAELWNHIKKGRSRPHNVCYIISVFIVKSSFRRSVILQLLPCRSP